MAMLPVKNSRKLFFRITLENADKESAVIIKNINDTWEDIEFLNYIWHTVSPKFCETNIKDEDLMMLFFSLCVFGKDFYIHLAIVDKLVQKLSKYKQVKELEELANEYKDFWHNIRIVRNCVVVHREKSNFIKPRQTNATTGGSGLEMELKYTDKKGREDSIKMNPLDDVYKCYVFMQKLEEILKENA